MRVSPDRGDTRLASDDRNAVVRSLRETTRFVRCSGLPDRTIGWQRAISRSEAAKLLLAAEIALRRQFLHSGGVTCRFQRLWREFSASWTWALRFRLDETPQTHT